MILSCIPSGSALNGLLSISYLKAEALMVRRVEGTSCWNE